VPADGVKRRLQQTDVEDEQEDCTNAHCPRAIGQRCQAHRGGHGRGEEHPTRGADGCAKGMGSRAQRGVGVQQRVEAAHDVGLAAVGQHVLRAGHVLLQEAQQFGRGLADAGEEPHHARLDSTEKPQHDEGVGQPHQTDAPILQKDQHQDAGDEQAVAEQVDDDLREVLGQLAHVAVDTLDQFPGRAQLVEAHIEAQHMGCQVGAQGVGRRPAEVFGQVDHDQIDGLLGQHSGEEQTGDDIETAR